MSNSMGMCGFVNLQYIRVEEVWQWMHEVRTYMFLHGSYVEEVERDRIYSKVSSA